MEQLEIKGQGGHAISVMCECIVRVEALNHDDSVRCVMCLYRTKDDYLCQRIDNLGTIDARYRLERCADALSIYQSFGTEPLANYLYGCAGLKVPGLRESTYSRLNC